MNIVVLAGGLSTERDVSFKSGGGMADALRRLGHRTILVDAFMGYGDSECDITGFFERDVEVSCPVPDIPKIAPDLTKIRALRSDKSHAFFGPNVVSLCKAADIVFIGLHGKYGEDGMVQAALDLYGVKYTGSGSLSSALAMNKNIAKKLLADAGIPVPEGFEVHEKEREAAGPPMIPCVVKPSNGGSSIGTVIVDDIKDYEPALDTAFSVNNEVIVERCICGREFTVAVLGGEALPSVEAVPVQGTFDYANKYAAGATVETCPADVPAELEDKMRELAVRSAKALGIKVYCRVDIMQNEATGELFVLEVNTLPGMTPTSFLPQEAAAVGMSYDELVDRILHLSLEKYKE